MKTTFLILLTFITTMIHAQEDFIKEPVLTGSMAAKIVQAAVEQAEKDGVFVTITVVDKSGQTLAVHRHHNAGVHTLRSSYKKAYTSASQKRETGEVAKGLKDGTIPEDARFLDENFLFLEGGVPIFINGKAVGGIGVGGAKGSQDVHIAKMGLKVLNL